MSKNILHVAKPGILLALCAAYGVTLGAPADLLYSSSPLRESSVLNYTTNGIVRTSSLFPSLSTQLYLLSFFFLLAFFQVNRLIVKLPEGKSLLFSSSFFLLLLSSQGTDYFVLSFLTGLLITLLVLVASPPNARFRAAFALGVLLSFLTPSAAAFLAPASALLKLILGKKSPSGSDKGDETFFWTLLVITWAFAYCSTPPELPVFPDFARIIPDDGLPGQFYSLVGSEPPLAVIDYVSIEAFYKVPSLVLLAVVTLITPLIGVQRSSVLFLPVLMLLFDVCLPENLSAIGPLQSIIRIVPGGSLISIVPSFFALTVLAILLVSIQEFPTSARRSALLLFCCVCGLFIGLRLPPFLVQPIPHEVPESERQFISSISLPVYQTYGASIVQAYRFSVAHPRTLEADFFDLRDDSLIRSLNDGAIETRWSLPSSTPADVSVRGIKVEFKRPTTLSRMALRLGPFRTDFPGSLVVKGSKDCSSPVHTWKIFFEVAKWLGPVEFTAEGYPYYGAEDKVWFPLQDAREIRCLAVLQPKVRGYFDWSIAEIVFHQDPHLEDEIFN